MGVNSPGKRRRSRSPTPSPPPSGKGKAKMEESALAGDGAGGGPAAADVGSCGICLTEEGRSVRGCIDSCDHYFCFVCIVEWAKIESRCPLCKQRFGSIRRPPANGVSFCERVVHVPVRDQVHQLYGNATAEDPYATISCSQCHGSTDENLLLLCDLCDSAAHTYCIGLGFTVPEGDWYCHDCTLLKNEHSKLQDDGYYTSEHSNRPARTKIEDCSPVTIFDIICDETTSNSFSLGRGTNDETAAPDRRVAGRESQGRAAVSQGDAAHSDEIASSLASVRESAFFPELKQAELGARTLHQRCNLHLHVRTLRENWYGLRSGSMNFKSSLVSSCGPSNSRKNNIRGVSSSISNLDYRSSGGNKDSITGSGVLSEMSNCSDSPDVSKAWKMLKIAKSMLRVETNTRSGHQSLKTNIKKNSCESKVPEHRTSVHLPENRKHENRLFCDTESEKYLSQSSFEFSEGKCTFQFSEKRGPDKLVLKEMAHHGQSSLLSVPRQDLKSIQLIYREEEAGASQHDIYDASMSVRQKDLPTGSVSSNCSEVGTFVPSTNQNEYSEYVACKKLPSDVKSVLVENANGSSTRNYDAAKSEIQSLVKLNLKLQSRGHHLGTEKFKEVARAATHSILAACGFCGSKPKTQHVSGSICRHSAEAKQVRRSNLMPDSCRECFYSFVKDVVDSMLSEKSTEPNSIRLK